MHGGPSEKIFWRVNQKAYNIMSIKWDGNQKQITTSDKSIKIINQDDNDNFVLFQICCGCRLVHLMKVFIDDDGYPIVSWETPNENEAIKMVKSANEEFGEGEIYTLRKLLREACQLLEDEVCLGQSLPASTELNDWWADNCKVKCD